MSQKKYQSLYVNFSGKNQKRPSSVGFVNHSFGLLIILLLVGGALGRVYLDSQTAKMHIKWQEIHEQINVLEKEADNLRMEQEKHMSGDYILREAQKLGLKPADPGQVRLMRRPATRSLNDDSLAAVR